AVEGGAGDDAGAHLVDEVEHFLVVGPGGGFDAVEAEGPGGAAAALVERCDEALARGDPVTLLLIHCHVAVLSSGGEKAVFRKSLMIPVGTGRFRRGRTGRGRGLRSDADPRGRGVSLFARRDVLSRRARNTSLYCLSRYPPAPGIGSLRFGVCRFGGRG